MHATPNNIYQTLLKEKNEAKLTSLNILILTLIIIWLAIETNMLPLGEVKRLKSGPKAFDILQFSVFA